MSLLLQLFSRLSKCFIIVEAEDIFQAHRDVPEWTKHFIELFQKLVDEAEGRGNRLKILVLGYGSIPPAVQSMPGKRNRIVSSIQRPQPVPPHLRRPFAASRNHSSLTIGQRLKPRIWIDFLKPLFYYYKSVSADWLGFRFIDSHRGHGNAQYQLFTPLGPLEKKLSVFMPWKLLYIFL